LALDDLYIRLGCKIHTVDFSRAPLSPDNARAYGQLKKVVAGGNYDIVHCHTPNAAVITRLVCQRFRKKTGLKVFYTAHGFHFFKGAPKLHWLVFYPIEKFCSRFTDKLITINQEDYVLAKAKFHAGEVCYVPGVGLDISKFENIQVDRTAKRREIGAPEDSFLLLSVGELNENKNHQVVIKAMARINNPAIHYVIAGVGDKREYLLELAKELGVLEQIHLLGYRKDIPELNYAADVFCFPSIREGLPVSLMEATAMGVPSIAAENRGTRDIIESDRNGLLCRYDSAGEFAQGIEFLYDHAEIRKSFSDAAVLSVDKFAVNNILQMMRHIYVE
jgi:glycosyltransferase involved in cell wall biosynthesis